MTQISRAEGAAWEPWPYKTPPKAVEFFHPCAKHWSCVRWRGTHFHAIRFEDGRIWDAYNGWRK